MIRQDIHKCSFVFLSQMYSDFLSRLVLAAHRGERHSTGDKVLPQGFNVHINTGIRTHTEAYLSHFRTAGRNQQDQKVVFLSIKCAWCFISQALRGLRRIAARSGSIHTSHSNTHRQALSVF